MVIYSTACLRIMGVELMFEVVDQNVSLKRKVEDLTAALSDKDADVIELREVNIH